MIDKDLYINHINDDEKIIKMKQVLDKIEIVLKNHIVEYTDFFDPYEISLAVSILNRFQEISYIISGGYESSERSILIIFPEYMYQGDIDLNLKFLEINGNVSNLRHPDFLGAILNLGITRDKVGDILIDNDRAVVVARSEISDFLYYNLEKISNINVKVNYISEININIEEEYEEIKVFLNSLRLDSVISSAYNISRKDSSNIILSNKVKVNWQSIDKVSYEINKNDLISTRGFGRVRVYDIIGKSRKDKLIVVLRKLL